MTKVELIAKPVLAARASLGEGAIWDNEKKRLYWIDINNCLLNSFDPLSGINKSLKLPAKPGCVVRRATANGGGFIIGMGGEFVHLKVVDDLSESIYTISVLAYPEEHVVANRMNDGKCDPAGRFWCGSMDVGCNYPSGNLWMLDKRQKLAHKLADVTISNGIVWNKAKDTMYYIDTATNRVDAFDYDNDTAIISNRRPLVVNQWGGHFDGMTIDSEDNLYIAVWGGSAVQKVSSASGQLLASIAVPGVLNVTSCAFGGDQLQDLYITSAQQESHPKASKAPNEEHSETNAGDLFKIHLSDCQGLPAYQYLG